MKLREFRADLLPKIRDLQIEAKQQVLSAMLTGEWISRLRGHGIEFAGYRQYTTGDDASLIDWRASLRSRKLVVKELQEERSLAIMLAVDVSDTMLVGTTDKIKAEYTAELVSSLAFGALHVGENVGMGLWSAGVKRFLPLGHGTAYHFQIAHLLSEIKHYGGEKRVAKSLQQLDAMMPQRGLFIVCTDAVGFDAEWERVLRIIASAHDLIFVVVRDPRDRRLPAHGEYHVEDPQSGQTLVIDGADYAQPYAEYVEKEEARIKQVVQGCGGDVLFLETTKPFKDILTNAMLQRKHRWWRD